MQKLIKFEADWCGPCHVIRPAINEIVEETGLELEVVDIDDNPDLAESYAVQSIPTILLVEDAAEIARHTGSAPKSKILANLGL